MLRAALRFAASSCLLAIVILSWLPKEMEVRTGIVRTGIAGQYEHVIAYAGTAALVKLGWPLHRTRWIGVILAVMAATLEVGQTWSPGRTPQFIDFAASSAGAFTGLLAAHTFLHRQVRRA